MLGVITLRIIVAPHETRIRTCFEYQYAFLAIGARADLGTVITKFVRTRTLVNCALQKSLFTNWTTWLNPTASWIVDTT
jgi:hypothetical protein